MALIECKECEGAISEFADVCPHCGFQTSMGKIEVKRIGTGYDEDIEFIQFYIDGQLRAWLTPDDSFETKIQEGSHELKVMAATFLRDLVVTVVAGESTHCLTRLEIIANRPSGLVFRER